MYTAGVDVFEVYQIQGTVKFMKIAWIVNNINQLGGIEKSCMRTLECFFVSFWFFCQDHFYQLL